jgi:hypothetical protein
MFCTQLLVSTPEGDREFNCFLDHVIGKFTVNSAQKKCSKSLFNDLFLQNHKGTTLHQFKVHALSQSISSSN